MTYSTKKLEIDPLKGSRNGSKIKKFNIKLAEKWKELNVDKLIAHGACLSK